MACAPHPIFSTKALQPHPSRLPCLPTKTHLLSSLFLSPLSGKPFPLSSRANTTHLVFCTPKFLSSEPWVDAVGGGAADRNHGIGWHGQGEASVEDDKGEAEEAEPVVLPQSLKLFVGNLPFDVDSGSLAQLFARAGEVEAAEVIYDRQTDQSRGFGFVTMSDLEGSEKAVDMFNHYDLDGRQLTVNRATPRGSKPLRNNSAIGLSHKIYVGNLPWEVDNAQLGELFQDHGKVIDARVVYEKETGRSRGFGFVRMSAGSNLDDIIAALNGKRLDGRVIRVDVAEEHR